MSLKPENAHIVGVFQATAEATGGDILQCCRDCGEDEVIDRDGLYDYLETFGGKHGKATWEWILNHPGSMEEIAAELDRAGVPRTWA